MREDDHIRQSEETMIDRYTKVVLTVIAAALMLLALQPFYAPEPAHAQSADLGTIEGYLSAISNGLCLNDKIC
jgi:hypothetical protein